MPFQSTTPRTTPTRSARRGVKALGGITGAILATGLAFYYWSAWQQTLRREAYLPQLEAEARAHPRDGRLLALLGARLAQTRLPKDEAKAAVTLTAAIAAGERNEQVWQTLAAAYALTGDSEKALSALRQGQAALSPASPNLDAALGRAQASGADSSPLALAQAVCPEGPDALATTYSDGSFLNGLAAWQGHRTPVQSGYATREEWIRTAPKDPMVQRLWALALLENRRLPAAIQMLQELTAADPTVADNWLALGQALYATGRFSESANAYLQALIRHPDWLPALLGLGSACARSGLDYERAAFLRASQIAPNDAEAWVGLARANMHSDFGQSALANFEVARKLAPERFDFLIDYATTLSGLGRFDEAEAILRQYLKREPENPEAHYALSNVLLEHNPTLDRLHEAETEVRESLRRAPHQADTERNLGDILLREGKPKEALSALQSSLTDAPQEPTTLRLLARAYSHAHQTDQATRYAALASQATSDQSQLDALTRDIDKRVLEPEFHRQLSRLFARTGHQEEAALEQKTLEQLLQDPGGFARRHQQQEETMARILGYHAPVVH